MNDAPRSEAPVELVAPTIAVRYVLLTEGSGHLYGTCIQGSLVLGWILKQRGYAAEMWSCSPNGWPHWCIRSGQWILDPAAGQFGDDNPPLLFKEGSPQHWYAPGRDETFPITTERIIDCLAEWIADDVDPEPLDELAGRSHAIPALLEVAGLASLGAVVHEAGVARAADSDRADELECRVQELRGAVSADDSD